FRKIMAYRKKRRPATAEAVKNGMPKLKISIFYGIPRTIIQFGLNDRFKEPGYEPSTYLTKDEDTLLVQ
ncbi:hypothetical protein HHI36_011055, partial [Cryptolaemus montrouzieri]